MDRKSTPDRIIKRFCKLFEKHIKKEVKRAKNIVFDIGYECGEKPNCLRNIISSKTLKKVTELNGEIAISIYPAVRESK